MIWWTDIWFDGGAKILVESEVEVCEDGVHQRRIDVMSTFIGVM